MPEAVDARHKFGDTGEVFTELELNASFSSLAIVPHFLCAEYRNENHVFNVHALFKYRPKFVNQSNMMIIIVGF